MALTAAQKKALKAAEAVSRQTSKVYEEEIPLNEAGVTIHFSPSAPGKNQGRFFFQISGTDSGLSYTTRTQARAGAQAYLDNLEEEPEAS